MKFKNNLTNEAYINSYYDQGYNEEQIECLMYMLENNLDSLDLMSVDIGSEHMRMFIALEEDGVDIHYEYFFADGTLDTDSLEFDFEDL